MCACVKKNVSLLLFVIIKSYYDNNNFFCLIHVKSVNKSITSNKTAKDTLWDNCFVGCELFWVWFLCVVKLVVVALQCINRDV